MKDDNIAFEDIKPDIDQLIVLWAGGNRISTEITDKNVSLQHVNTLEQFAGGRLFGFLHGGPEQLKSLNRTYMILFDWVFDYLIYSTRVLGYIKHKDILKDSINGQYIVYSKTLSDALIKQFDKISDKDFVKTIQVFNTVYKKPDDQLIYGQVLHEIIGERPEVSSLLEKNNIKIPQHSSKIRGISCALKEQGATRLSGYTNNFNLCFGELKEVEIIDNLVPKLMILSDAYSVKDINVSKRFLAQACILSKDSNICTQFENYKRNKNLDVDGVLPKTEKLTSSSQQLQVSRINQLDSEDKLYALEKLEKLAELDHVDSLKILGEYHRANMTKSKYYYKKAAELGDAESMSALAKIYHRGDQIFHGKIKDSLDDNREALIWYQKAALLNNLDALEALSSHYHRSQRDKNIELSCGYLNQLAKVGTQHHIALLADAYQYGSGCVKDLELSFKWHLINADLGNRNSMSKIIDFYRGGLGVEKSMNNAIEWTAHHIKTQDLSEVSSPHIGFLKNSMTKYYFQTLKKPENTIGWLERLANYGDVNAMKDLVYLYHYGYGVPQDSKRAKFWYYLMDMTIAFSQEKNLFAIYAYPVETAYDYDGYYHELLKFTIDENNKVHIQTINKYDRAVSI